MATIRAVIIRGFLRPDGTANIKIRITQKRKSAFISTDLYVRPGDFRRGSATGINADFINMRILDLLSTYQRRYMMLGSKAEKHTAAEIKSIVRADNANTDISFTDFAEKYLKQLKADGRDGSYRGFHAVVEKIKKFRAEIKFADIDAMFLQKFERWLRQNNVNDAVPTYMTRLRVIFNAGRLQYNDEDRGIIRIPNYPFRRYLVQWQQHRSQDHALTVDQVKELIAYEPTSPRQALGRDVFLLMLCLMGINSKDIFYLPKPHAGRIHYNRSKTGHKFNVKVEPEAAEILTRYDFSRYCDYLHFQKAVNLGLHKISEAKKWPRLTSNWARHTWATIARNDCRISKSDVALCMGHKDRDNTVTDIYIRYGTEIQDEANRKVLDKIFS